MKRALREIGKAVSWMLPVVGCFFLMGVDCGGHTCMHSGKTYRDGESFPSDDGCNTCSCANGVVACDQKACAARWFKTCGDPVCMQNGHRVDPNVKPCTTQNAGDACTDIGKKCDLNDPCNVDLICATSDPTKQQGGCPVSLARYKRDIRYLDAAGLEAYRQALLGMKLATYRYKAAGPGAPDQLGFIIDDLGDGAGGRSAVNADGQSVNLYGYASMAVAALQLQQKEIAELKEQVAALRRALDAAHGGRPSGLKH